MNRKRTKFISLDPHRCVACWECIDACPKQVIGKVSFLWHRHTVFADADACIGCRKCIKACPQQVFSEIQAPVVN